MTEQQRQGAIKQYEAAKSCNHLTAINSDGAKECIKCGAFIGDTEEQFITNVLTGLKRGKA